jgi:hypothetical protein
MYPVEVRSSTAVVGSFPVPSPRSTPRWRPGTTVAFVVGGAYGHLITSCMEDGSLADVRVVMSKEGSTVRGMTDAISATFTVGLRHGVPLVALLAPLLGTRFEPSGMTDDPEIPEASSIVDYVARRLALDYLTAAECGDLNVFGVGGPLKESWTDYPAMIAAVSR